LKRQEVERKRGLFFHNPNPSKTGRFKIAPREDHPGMDFAHSAVVRL
jgi:hypothetical protein